MKSLRISFLVLLSLAVAAPLAARPRVPAAWPGVSDVLLNVAVAAPVAAWPTTPVAGWPENDSERPGSVLVFPKWREGTRVTTDQGRVPNTEFEVSVKCPVLDCTTLPGYPNVTIKGHWVCQGDQGPETPGICHETDFTFTTTVNATVYLTSECLADRTTGLPAGCVNQANGRYTSIPRPPCDQFDVPPGSGNFFDNEVYLILWMVNANNQAIKWDGLTGDAILRQVPNESNAVEGYTPVPIQAGEGLATGDLTDVNGDRALDFDGTEYRMLTGQVAGTVRYQDESFVSPATKLANPSEGQGEIDTHLTLITLDVLSNRPNDVTFVDLTFYNEAESPHSTGTSFVCLRTQDLNGAGSPFRNPIDPFLDQNFGRKGLALGAAHRLDGTPVSLIVFYEVRETQDNPFLNRAYAYYLFHDGDLLRTAFVPNEVQVFSATPPVTPQAPAASPSLVPPVPTPPLPSLPKLP